MIGRTERLSYQNIPILVKQIHPNAKLPTQAIGDVGFDLTCPMPTLLEAGKVTHVPIGLQLAEAIEPLFVDGKISAVPFLKVEGRSGLARRGIFPVGGIIDPNYRGEIGCLLFNSSGEDFWFDVGDRVAQLVIYYTLSNASPQTLIRFFSTDAVSETDRGDKGFGSSGK
jgi:dUTP pyrophosphatase